MMTALDGYPMHQKGQGALALGHAAVASMIGGAIGALLLIALAPLIAEASLLVRTTGKFSLLLFAMVVIVIAQRGNVVKGAMAACLGLMLATIGLDTMVQVKRFTYGLADLTSGIELMPVIIGAFAVSEILTQTNVMQQSQQIREAVGKMPRIRRRDFIPSWAEIRKVGMLCYVRSSLIGYAVGTLPGAGGSMGGFLAYIETVLSSKQPETFGKGNPQGIASAESANNAVCGGALDTMLTFGIPGDPITAIVLGVLVIKVVSIRKDVLYAIIGLLSVVGSYVATFSTFQMMMTLAMGVLAYHLRKRDFPVITLLLGFILGPNPEEFLRRSLTLSQGDPMIFLTNPDSLFFILLTLVFIYFLAIRKPLAAPDATLPE